MHTLENEFLELIRGCLPQPGTIKLKYAYVNYRNQHLSDVQALI